MVVINIFFKIFNIEMIYIIILSYSGKRGFCVVEIFCEIYRLNVKFKYEVNINLVKMIIWFYI